MSRSPTGAHPTGPRKEHVAMAYFRSRQREVFGCEPPPEPPPRRPAMPPQPTSRYARPVRVEHQPGCDSARVETTGWTDGRRHSRCLDCLAETTVGP